MRIRLHEPAVALTDLAVAIEAGAFAFGIARMRPAAGPGLVRRTVVQRWFTVLFAATSVAALAGAALHGLIASRESIARLRLWRLSLGSIGVAGLSAWCLAAALALPRAAAGRVERLAGAAHLAYLAIVARSEPPYAVAIATYLPGSLALAGALVGRLRHPGARGPAAIGLAGLALTIAAAVAQVRRIAVHPRLFDHNATYHSIQALALACFWAAARGFLQPGGRR